MTAPQNVDQLPFAVNLNIYRGDDVFFTLAVTDPAGAPADLTGQTPASQIRADFKTDIISATIDTVVNGSDIECHIANADTAVLAASELWDLQITSADGHILTLAAGKVTVTGEVTRP